MALKVGDTVKIKNVGDNRLSGRIGVVRSITKLLKVGKTHDNRTVAPLKVSADETSFEAENHALRQRFTYIQH